MTTASSPTVYYIGIDVGTGSARAALHSSSGELVASYSQSTQTWRDKLDHRIFEQSTTDIWTAICTCVRKCLDSSGVAPEKVKGLGFDATCSLAVIDRQGAPVCVTKNELGKSGERNIILWADHRAEQEAERINKTGAVPLDFVGGTMSVRRENISLSACSEVDLHATQLEMEIPKILWLKNNMPADAFSKCQFFDLPDYLTYRATDASLRSFCSLTCKCSYVPSKGGWQADFFRQIGLDEFVEEGYDRLGGRQGEVRSAGMPVGDGLSLKAAEEMGLKPGTPVGSGIIDAYVGLR